MFTAPSVKNSTGTSLDIARRLLVAAASISAFAGLTTNALAEDTSVVAEGGVGGSTSPLDNPPVNANGVFAPAYADAYGIDARQRVARTLVIYAHDKDSPDMYNAAFNKYGATSAYDYMNKIVNDERQWLAVNSGGKMDSKFDLIDSGNLGYKPDGTQWGAPSDALAVMLANNPQINVADYDYIQIVTDNLIVETSYNSPYFSSRGSGFTLNTHYTNSNGFDIMGEWSPDRNRRHELGHMLGFDHAKSDITPTNTTTPGDYAPRSYTYDFTNKQYVDGTAVKNDVGMTMSPLGITLWNKEYGAPNDTMASGSQQYAPRDKLKAGWLDYKTQFKRLTPGINGATSTITVHDDTKLVAVVNGATGDALRYGVESGYSATPYAATFVRKGLSFVPNADGTGGKWVQGVQVIDLYYREISAGKYGLQYRIDGDYYGTIQLNQKISEKDFGKLLYLIQYGVNGQVTVAPPDLVDQLHATAPDNPDRFSSVKYDIKYAGDATDAAGSYGNIEITTHVGNAATGLRWNTGSGTWTSGAVWTDLDNANAAKSWESGRHVVFGDASRAAGTVTVTGSVNAESLTFKPTQSGAYTITGGTVNLGNGGINAEASATIASNLNYNDRQVWEILANKTVALSGTITDNGNALQKIGLGELRFNSANTLTALDIYEGTATQYADMTVVTRLGLFESGEYVVKAGTLRLGNNAQVTGGNNLPAALHLTRTNSTITAPELQFLGRGDFSADLLLDAGQHVIQTGSNLAKITGIVRGAGGITLYADSTSGSNRLELSGTNTFTGDIEIQRGSLHLTGVASLSGNNVLRFNTASGDTGRFYLNGSDRSVRDLSSTGAGSAIIANAQGAVAKGLSDAATLRVTQNNAGTFGGVITDTSNDSGGTGVAAALGLEKLGSATLTLTGSNDYTGTTTISAGVLQIGNGGTSGTLGSGAVINNATLSFNRAGAITATNAISGSGALTKNGSGILTLSGISTYTGATQVSDGTLLVNGALGDTAVTVASGAKLGGTGRIGEIATHNATVSFATGSTLLSNAADSTPGHLDVRGSVYVNGATTIDFATKPVVGTYRVLDYSGALNGASNFSLNLRGTISTATANQVNVNITAAGALLWKGSTDGNWGLKDGKNNFLIGASADNFFSQDSITMDDTATTKVVTLTGQLRPSALTVNATQTYTLQGAGSLTGTGTLTKQNSGTLIVTAANTGFSGDTTVSAGTLQLGNNTASGDLGMSAISIATGASLKLNRSDANTLANALAGTGGLTQSGAGTVTLTGDNSGYTGKMTIDAGKTLAITTLASAGGSGASYAIAGTLEVNNAAELLLNGRTYAGGGLIHKTGGGKLVMWSSNSTYTGKFLIDSGEIGFGQNPFGATPGTAVADRITLNGGSLTNETENGKAFSTVAIATNNGVTLGNSGGSFRVVRSGFTFTVDSAITGAGMLSKTGTGTLILKGANTHLGGTTITAGTLTTAHVSALGSGNVSVASGATLQIGDGTTNGVTLGTGATLALDANATLKLAATNSKITMGSGGVYTLTSGFNLDITGLNFGAGNYTLITGVSGLNTLGTWSASTDLLGGSLANYSYSLAKAGNNVVFTVTAIPEPATYGLLGAGILAAAAMVRRRKRTAQA